MKIQTYTVKELLCQHDFIRKLRAGVVVSFIFTASVVGAMPSGEYHSQAIPEPATIVTLTVKDVAKKVVAPNAIEILSDVPTSLSFKTDQAFERMIVRQPEAIKMVTLAKQIRDGMGEFNAERVTMDCDLESEVLNVSYRLPDNMLMSISKPLDTIDDDIVQFNLYHDRELLLADTASIYLLSQYIHNVESRLSEQM